MEMELWQLVKSAEDLVKSDAGDNVTIVAYFLLALLKKDSYPVILLILLSSSLFEVTLHLPEYQFFILCSIMSSYVTTYYYNKNNRVCIGLAMMTFYLFFMGQEILINAVISEQFYLSIYDSYEICISAIHLFTLSLFIKWRRIFNALVEFINGARTMSNGFNNLFNVL